MGKMQRNKGARIERELVAQLKSEGWSAMRVPLSGATTYAKGDVDVWDETGFRFNIEVKSRKDGFKKIYNLIGDTDRDWMCNNIRFTKNVSILFEDHVRNGAQLCGQTPEYFNTLRKLKGDSLILAIKANNKPFIFIRWFDEVL